MKVAFRIQGVEQRGEAREVSTLGAFVVAAELPPPGPIRLTVAEEQAGRLELSGEVVQARPEGFAVVFDALPPETLERFAALLEGREVPPAAPAPSAAAPIPIRDEDWTPPLSPVAEGPPGPDAASAMAAESGREEWEGWPTISEGGIEVARMSVEAAAPPAVRPAEPPPPAAEPPPAAAAPELERRASDRHDRELPVTFENLTSLIKEFTHNISFGGLLFYTDRPVQAGGQVVVTLIHPVNGERLTLPARVARAQDTGAADGALKRIAVGVEFLLPLPELQRLLSAFISSSPSPPAADDAVLREARAMLDRPAATPAEVLGVPAAASPEQARRAYFALVDRFHPDRHRERLAPERLRVLEELFRKLTQAYEEFCQKR